MTYSSFTGQRFPFQDRVGGMRGGMMSEPYSGVVSGLIVTAGTITANACPLNISAGSARLDGQLCTLGTAISGLSLIGGTGMFASDGTYGPYPVHLRPRRVVETTLNDPTGSAPAGTQRIKVQNRSNALLGDYDEFVALFQYSGTAWVLVQNPLESQPPSAGLNNSPFNDVLPTIDSSTSNNTSFFLTPEKAVYWPAPVVHAPNQGIDFLRRTASVLLALVTVTVSGGGSSRVASITTYSDFEKVPM